MSDKNQNIDPKERFREALRKKQQSQTSRQERSDSSEKPKGTLSRGKSQKIIRRKTGV